MTLRDSSGNVFVDFVWGNIPLQPNDDRGMAQLDPDLDNHEIAVGSWSGFPEFDPDTGFAPPPPPPSVDHNISGIRKQWQGSDLAYNFFYMFLNGRNHNLYNGNNVNITGCDVSEYNKNGWIVYESVNDDTFNTGGTKVTIFWNGVISETANGSGGTYTKV